MRPFKFRAWNKKTGKWQHETPCDILGEMILLGGWMAGVRIPDLNEIVVMQFTGLQDKNGKDIYEGDIVDCQLCYDGDFLPHRGEIVYNSHFGAFATRNLSGETLLHKHLLSSLGIIGNIYQNPELMGGGQ